MDNSRTIYGISAGKEANMLIIKKLTEEKLRSLSDYAEADAALQPGGLAGALRDGLTVFLMLLDGKTAGVLAMKSDAEGSSPAFARVTDVFVVPALRRHGLGRMLMCSAAGEAVERKTWFLGCSAALSEAGAAFAEAMHFRAGTVPGTLLLDLSDVEGLRHG